MKKTRFTALVLALVMCICSVPFATAGGDLENVISFESGGYAVYGKNYFTVGLSVYDKLGNYVGEIPEEDMWDHPVHTIGDNCIITTDSYLDAVEGYSIYNVENGNIVKKSSYPLSDDGIYYIAMPYTDGDFTLIVGLRHSLGEKFTYNNGEYDAIVENHAPANYILLDSYGNEVHRGDCSRVMYVNGGVLVVEDDDGNSHICTDLYADELVFEDFEYHVVYATDMGDLVFEEDGEYGIVTWEGDEIAISSYNEIVEYGEYYICRVIHTGDDYIWYECSVKNRNGDRLSSPLEQMILAYSERVFLDIDPYGLFCLRHTNNSYRYDEVTIDRGDVASSDGTIFYIASSETNSGKLYDDRGEVLLSGEGCNGEFSSDVEAGIIVGSFDSEDYAVYDMKGQLIRELDCDRAYTAQNGYIVLEDSSKGNAWIEKDGKAVTEKHKYCEEYFEMAGCDVFVMGNDAGFTVYIAKKPVPFGDIDASHWAYASVAGVYSDGNMNGVGGDKFDPNGTVTRAQVMTALWRLAGCPDPVGGDYFPSPWEEYWGEWFATALEWAVSIGLTTGVSSENPDKFDPAPHREITRVEMVTFISRFAEYVDKRPVDYEIDTSVFADSADIPTWCNFEFCYATGIIKGKAVGDKVYFAPNDTLTRAELAAILERY